MVISSLVFGHALGTGAYVGSFIVFSIVFNRMRRQVAKKTLASTVEHGRLPSDDGKDEPTVLGAAVERCQEQEIGPCGKVEEERSEDGQVVQGLTVGTLVA